MKEKVIELKLEKTTYITCDGKVFESKVEAVKYEETYKASVLRGFDEFPKQVDVSSCDLGLPWSNEDTECYLVMPQSSKDIEFLNIFLGIFDDVDRYLDEEDIDRSIIFDLGYDRTRCLIYDAEKLIESIEDQYKQATKKLKELRKD